MVLRSVMVYGMVDGYHVLSQLTASILRQNLEAVHYSKTQVYTSYNIPQYCDLHMHCSDSLQFHQHSLCNCNLYNIFLGYSWG